MGHARPSGYERYFGYFAASGGLLAALSWLIDRGAIERLPLGVQIVLVALAVAVGLLPCGLLLTKPLRAKFIGLYQGFGRERLVVLLLGLTGVFFAATWGFGVLSGFLYLHGVVSTSSPLDEPYNDFWFFLAWNFLDEIPVLELPKTLSWEEPLETTDRLSPWLLLAYKLAVIVPVIATAVLAWRNR